MFIAHLPAAYLLSKAHPILSRERGWLFAGALLPDADLLVFYLWHAGGVHHHSYLTHRPALWACVLCFGFATQHSQFGKIFTSVGIGALLHLVLDSVVGQIAWGWPISNAAYPMVIVPARYDWWVLSFLIHWTFLAELVICFFAVWINMRTRVHSSTPL